MEEFKQYLNLVNNCEKDQPLLSETNLGQQLNQFPLNQVQPKTFAKLCQSLNIEQLITTKKGLARDYRGLSELMGFSTPEIETHIKKSSNPTKSAIEAYIIKQCNTRNIGLQVTLNDLIKMIEQIERYDVIDDFIPELVNIAQSTYLNLVPERNLALEVRSLSNNDQSTLVQDTRLLTIDDTKQPLRARYDAFICFAPEDYQHAESLIAHLEQNGKTVATSSDLLPGNFEHDSLVQLIDSRCRKVITILTPNFLKSKECEFQTKFANEIGIKAGSPKIIPVLCETCDDLQLPPLIRVISKIDLTNPQSRLWQLNKLLSSLTQFDENYSDHIQQPRAGVSNRLREELSPRYSRRPNSPLNTQNDHNPGSIASRAILYGDSPSKHTEPIVELMHSEISGAGSSETVPQKEVSNNDKDNSTRPFNWLKQKLRRATSGSQTLSTRSSSSRAGLLSETSSDLLSDECPSINLKT